jgi:hypothetical protein
VSAITNLEAGCFQVSMPTELSDTGRAVAPVFAAQRSRKSSVRAPLREPRAFVRLLLD